MRGVDGDIGHSIGLYAVLGFQYLISSIIIEWKSMALPSFPHAFV